jgi:hypothetical protein
MCAQPIGERIKVPRSASYYWPRYVLYRECCSNTGRTLFSRPMRAKPDSSLKKPKNHPYNYCFSTLSTHSVTIWIVILFESIRSRSAGQGFDLVIASAGLLFQLIHLTSAISRRSYDCRRHIRSTISRFSFVVPSLTRHSYNDFESVHRTSGRGALGRKISWIVALIAAAISNPWVIAYSSEANTLRVARLHLTEDQWRILALLLPSVSVIENPIWLDRSLLSANDESVKATSRSELFSSRSKCNPLTGFSF